MYRKMSPNNGCRWCPLGKLSHLGLEQLIIDLHLVQLDECYISKYIQHKIEFSWWLFYMITKRYRILVKMKSNYWSLTHKYVPRVHKYIVEAKPICEDDNNTFCIYTTQINMKDIMVVFRILVRWVVSPRVSGMLLRELCSRYLFLGCRRRWWPPSWVGIWGGGVNTW